MRISHIIPAVLALGVLTACGETSLGAPPTCPSACSNTGWTIVPLFAPCVNEDGPGPCRWDAGTAGNGVGMSFTIRCDPDGAQRFVYDNTAADRKYGGRDTSYGLTCGR